MSFASHILLQTLFHVLNTVSSDECLVRKQILEWLILMTQNKRLPVDIAIVHFPHRYYIEGSSRRLIQRVSTASFPR